MKILPSVNFGRASSSVAYVLWGKKSLFGVCVELNLKCWQCFPGEINKDVKREVLKRRVILFKAIEEYIHIISCAKVRRKET